MLRHIGALLYMKFKTLSKNKSLFITNDFSTYFDGFQLPTSR